MLGDVTTIAINDDVYVEGVEGDNLTTGGVCNRQRFRLLELVMLITRELFEEAL